MRAVIIKLNCMPFGCLCKQQSSVALCTNEVKFFVARVGGQELRMLRELMNELELGVEQQMRMLIDNQATVVQTGSVASSAKAKHMDVRLVTMRDFIAK